MSTNLASKTLSARHWLASLPACLCCIGLLATCGKEPPQRSSTEAPQPSPNKHTVPSGEVKVPITLQSVTLQLKSQGGDWKARNDAINLVEQLGKQKQVAAIPSLLDAMFLVQPFSINNVADYADAYPCSSALVEIGEPAVSQIQARVLATGTNIEQMVLLDTLRRIKGSEYVARWLDGLPDKGSGSIPEQRRNELKQWALRQAH